MLFSIIIPCQRISSCLREETIPAILKQKGAKFEIIVIPDQQTNLGLPKTSVFPQLGSPSQKRNLGLKKAKGEVVVFIDDDAYPSPDWLKNIAQNFKKSLKIAGLGGPGLTPPQDSFWAKISGWFWASPLGSGGAGQYRNWPQKKRLVDDYPTFNLAVKKEVLKKIGGFSCQFWPGEDTKLCLDLVYQLGKKIIYDPKSVVFHHRRKIFLPHLKQLGRYGYHRGLFVKLFPQTSRKIGYFLPALFSIGLLLGPIFYWLLSGLNLGLWASLISNAYLFCLGLYGVMLILNSFWVLGKSKNVAIAFLLLVVVPMSHVYYGFMFVWGLIARKDQLKKI
ncbi:MAG: glycosyltransferase [Candidatus Shapirobacteria bacterium]|nr:glycosyltransferase [Candidatus Shapirobacteria bacterium]